MEKREMVYEGKAKKVFRTDDEKLFVIQYKDDATAFNGEKKGTIGGKGIINNNMSVLMFKMLEEHGIPTHLVEHMNDRETLVKAVTILPLEVIVRNVAAGSFSKRYGVTEGTVLPFPTFEFSYKNDDLGDPLINESHALAMGIATQEQMDIVRAYALKINELMKDFFLVKGIKLIDFKGLSGDKSDNIPGIMGVGEKTATKLLLHIASFNSPKNKLKQQEASTCKIRQ